MKGKLKLITFLTAMVMAVVGICGCLTGCEENVGTVYELEEAYNQGVITTEELKDIAYYWNLNKSRPDGWVEESYVPMVKDPETLDKKTENKIKRAFRDTASKSSNPSLDKIHVQIYYGTYNRKVAVRILDGNIIVDIIYPRYFYIGEQLICSYYGDIYIWTE